MPARLKVIAGGIPPRSRPRYPRSSAAVRKLRQTMHQTRSSCDARRRELQEMAQTLAREGNDWKPIYYELCAAERISP